MVEIDIEELTKNVVKSLTPKLIRVLDRLGLTDAGIADELGCGTGTISQDLNKIYSKFGDPGIIDFSRRRNRNKRSTLTEVWPEIRKRHQLEIREILERRRGKAD